MTKKPKRPLEKDLYPRVERWLKRKYKCFATATNAGLRYSRPDVIGIRDIGGDLSGEVESIVVEVKRGTQPFATASGQTLGYRVYANRVYLAEFRTETYSPEEIHIASHLGIGLIQITASRCYERLSSPHYDPITKLRLALLERLHLGNCQLCGSMFKIGRQGRWFANMSRANIQKAVRNGKGYVFWNWEVADRKARLGVRGKGENTTYERRFLCPDCVYNIFSHLDTEEGE